MVFRKLRTDARSRINFGALLCVKSSKRWQIAEITRLLNLLIPLRLVGFSLAKGNLKLSNNWLRVSSMSLIVMVLVSLIGFTLSNSHYRRAQLPGLLAPAIQARQNDHEAFTLAQS
jgi:hypothetical protein